MSHIDFACRVCGTECDSAPNPPDRAICPKCCEDHDYKYVREECGYFCDHCGEQRPYDWDSE